MKAVHLSSVHPPFDIRIFRKECRTLAESGHKVVLVVQHERDEVVEGVQIRALPKARNRADRALRLPWRVLKLALAEDGDCYHFHDFELIPVALLLSLRGKKVVYDVHEDVPRDILDKEYLHPLVRRVLSPLAGMIEEFAKPFLSGIVAATPAIAQRFPRRKTILVQNFPRTNEFDFSEALPYNERPPVLLHLGMLTAVRGARAMVDAMDIVAREHEASLAMAGYIYPPALAEELKQAPGWRHVDFLGQQSRRQVAQLLSRARMGLVLFHPGPTHPVSQPTKIFEYMLAGLPVIASDFPHWRQLVGQERCALFVDPTDARAVAQAVTWLLQNPEEAAAMGRRGRELILNQLNWDQEGTKLVEFYQRLAGPRAA